MNDIQEFVRDDQVLVVVPEPLLRLEDAHSHSRPRSCAVDEEPQALSAPTLLSPAPAKEDVVETETREPLRELCKNDKESSENPEQEQNQEEDTDSSDKVTDYVSKVLEKLVKQRVKTSKLSAILEKKGLAPEKKSSQLQSLIHELEEIQNDNTKADLVDENDSDDNNSKENLSPLRPKYAAKADALVPSTGSKDASPTHKKPLDNYTIEDVLQISRRDISYGFRFPGQVVEEHLDIVNKSGCDFVVQIIVSCINDDLQDTEEYVYSVRRSHLYDYNDKHYLIMAPHSCAGFKFALKVPNMKLNGTIMGQIKISVQGMSGSYTLDLTTNVAIPKVFCPKELHFKGLNYNIVKLAVKEGKKQDMKIPIRNSGDVPITLELEFYEPKDGQESGERPLFDCLVHPNVINIAPNSNALTTIMVKPWKIMMQGVDKPKGARKILTGRVRDSALVYSFVFWIEVY